MLKISTTKQERLHELQQLKQETQQNINELTKLLSIANSSPTMSLWGPHSLYEIEAKIIRDKKDEISIKLGSEKKRLQQMEAEYAKIEAMSTEEANTYIRRNNLKQKGNDILDKTLTVIFDMTPEPVYGRFVKVSDNFLKYWLIFITIGTLIIFIFLGVSK